MAQRTDSAVRTNAGAQGDPVAQGASVRLDGEAQAGSQTSADTGAVIATLQYGDLHLNGRLVDSSNNAMVGTVTMGGSIPCVYKPIMGERPLWDFPQGALARREVAAFHVSEAAGWHCVPPAVFRDGPFGPGMVQQWIDDADEDQVAGVFEVDQLPAGWLPVFRAATEDGEPLVVAHANSRQLATIAVFDVVTNNADRKAPHLLARPDGPVLGVDHGLTFHIAPKLRTILWGWAGEPIPDDLMRGLERLKAGLGHELAAELSSYLATEEIDALTRRVRELLADPVFPLPPTDRPAIPWPPL